MSYRQTTGGRRLVLPLIAMGVVMACGFAGSAAAQAYPVKPVTIINPFPGGATEIGARVYSQKLGESLGKPFIIDYKPGAGSVIATNFVARAPADGYTLLITSAAFTIVPATRSDLPYDPFTDLAPISLTLIKPAMLLVKPELPIRNFEEYVAYARTNPGKLNFGTTGMGGAYHMVGVWLHGGTNTQATFLHYKGTSALFADLLAGRIDVTPSSIFNGLTYVKSGKLRPVAVLGKERSPMVPGLKTVAEQGLPDFDYFSWEAMFTGGKVPRSIVATLSAEFGKIAKMPDVIQKFSGSDGSILLGSNAEVLAQHVATEIGRWKKIVKDNNIVAAED